MKKWRYFLLHVLWSCLLVLAACDQEIVQPLNSNELKVVATTTIVGDVVSQVGGNLIELNVLLPVGTDPHSFNPTPQDIARVAEADWIFANGFGLEDFLDYMIESAGATGRVQYVSEGIDLRETATGLDHQGVVDEGVGHGGIDPHTWSNPDNVLFWVSNIEERLSDLDPENAEVYHNNAEVYAIKLKELDAWIRERVAQLQEADKKLVTDHGLFGYFADAYGFELIGTLIPGYSTLAEPSAQELAEMEDTITALSVKVIFVGNTANPTLAERVSQDTGTRLVFVYTGSLSESGGEAGTYIDYMRYNTSVFVDALK